MRVEKLRSRYGLEVTFVHFPLHPNTPEEGLTLEQLFAGRDLDIPRAQARMEALVRAEGLPYGKRTMTYNSRLAQELAKWADSKAPGSRVHDALFQAYFVNDLNLAKVDHLVDIARGLGLPAEEARTVLVQRRYRSAVDEDWRRSREAGVTGVPDVRVSGPRRDWRRFV